MRLSPFHKHLAKLIAQGLPNREIMKQVQISGSRLSVLKHNPLMIREVEKWSQLEDSKYAKAIEVIGDRAEEVARKLVDMVTVDVGVEGKVKAQLGLELLGRVSGAEGYGEGRGKEAEGGSFEETLQLTRRVASSGGGGIDEQTLQQAFIELEEDKDKAEEEEDRQVLDIEAIEVGRVLGGLEVSGNANLGPNDVDADPESPSEESEGPFNLDPELAGMLSG